MQLPDFVPPTSAGLLPCVGNSRLYDSPSTASAAAALCSACPVRQQCDTWAVQRQEWGTWAGRTDDDRGTPRDELPDTPRLAVAPDGGCGTERARRQHIGRQEVCQVCNDAFDARVRADRVARLAAEHGRADGPTREGYRLHLLLGEQACPDCLAAHSARVQMAKAA